MSRIGQRLPAIEVVPDPEDEPVPNTTGDGTSTGNGTGTSAGTDIGRKAFLRREMWKKGGRGKAFAARQYAESAQNENAGATRAAGHFPPEQKRCSADSVKMPVNTHLGQRYYLRRPCC